MLRLHQMQEVTSVHEPCCSFGSRFASYVSCMQYTNPYLAGRREHVHFHRHSRARVMPCAYKLGSLRFLCSSLAALLIKRVAIFSTPKMGNLGSMDRVLIADSHATDGGKWESCDADCEDNTCVWSYRLLCCEYEVAAPAHRTNVCFWPRSGTQNLIPKVCLMPLPRLSSQDSTYLKINQHVTASCCRKHACKLSCEAMHAWRAFSPGVPLNLFGSQ